MKPTCWRQRVGLDDIKNCPWRRSRVPQKIKIIEKRRKFEMNVHLIGNVHIQTHYCHPFDINKVERAARLQQRRLVDNIDNELAWFQNRPLQTTVVSSLEESKWEYENPFESHLKRDNRWDHDFVLKLKLILLTNAKVHCLPVCALPSQALLPRTKMKRHLSPSR